MEEKLSIVFLRDGQNAMMYVQSLNPAMRPIATEAILECLRLGWKTGVITGLLCGLACNAFERRANYAKL